MEVALTIEGKTTDLDSHFIDKPTCSKDIVNEAENASDSTQIGLIDEDEARKIDKVL